MSEHEEVMENSGLLTALPALPATWQRALWAGGGSCLAILLLQALGQGLHYPLLLAPFGASCVLLFVLPESEFSRPRNILSGYAIATVVGFGALWLFGEQWWTVSVAVGLTVGLMCLTHTVHPPAGAHPIVIVMAAPALPALLLTLALGLALLMLWAWGFHRFIRRERHWPCRS